MPDFNPGPRAIALTVVIVIWFVGTLGLFIGANSRNQSGIMYSFINLLGLVFAILLLGPLFQVGRSGLAIFVGLILTNIGLPVFLIRDAKYHKQFVERRRKEPVHSIKEREPEVWDGPKIPEDPFQGNERLRSLFESSISEVGTWLTLKNEIKGLRKTAEAMQNTDAVQKLEYLEKWIATERDRIIYEKQCAEGSKG